MAACFRLTAAPAAALPCSTDPERPTPPRCRRYPSPGADRCGGRASTLRRHPATRPRSAHGQCAAWRGPAEIPPAGRKRPAARWQGGCSVAQTSGTPDSWAASLPALAAVSTNSIAGRRRFAAALASVPDRRPPAALLLTEKSE